MIFTTNIMKNHFQSPLNKAGNNPKKKVVQEKPTFTCLNWFVTGFFKLTRKMIPLICTAFNDDQIVGRKVILLVFHMKKPTRLTFLDIGHFLLYIEHQVGQQQRRLIRALAWSVQI